MADNLQNVAIPQNVWINLYALTGITVGTQLVVENSGDIDVYLAVQATKPDQGHNAYNVVKRPPSVSVQNTEGDPGAWAFCQGGSGKLSISTLSREGFIPYNKIQITDETNRVAELDVLTRYLVAILSTHHQRHEGITYCHTGKITLNTNGVKEFILVTPDTTRWTHFNVNFGRSASAGELEVVENITTTDDGAITIPQNDNRNVGNNSVDIFTQNPTGVTGGTIVYQDGWGSGQSAGGTAFGERNEKIFRQNTKYLIRLRSLSANNIMRWDLSWYEHLNK